EEAAEQSNYYESIRLEHQILFSVPVEVKKNTLQYIVDEIISTERKYVADMEKVLVVSRGTHPETGADASFAQEYKNFLEERCPEKVDAVFGNMEQIYSNQTNFLHALESPQVDIKAVAHTFLEFEDLFRLYPRYFRNTPKANAAVKELSFLIKEKQERINDKLDLSAYLLTPIQRLGKYKLFLENIIKQLQKDDRPIGLVQLSLDMVKKYMSKGNDAVALASILFSPLHTKDYGSFIAREKFTVLKPKKAEMMVFLFEGVVVFTVEDPKNLEQFVYQKSIRTHDLRIATFDNDNTIQLTDFTKTKRRNSSKHTYILDTKSPKVKEAWKLQIEDILWKQMKKIKENTLKAYQKSDETPVPVRKNPRKREQRAKSTGDTELVKESISSPAECKQVGFNEEDFDFSRSSIQCCPFDISGYGSFLLMDEFKVRKPKKMKIMVFLFQKIVIFTKKQLNEEAFYYIGSVKMDQISVLPQGKNMKILQLKDHLASARFHKETVFSLEAASEYIQLQWRRTVEKCLWGQLIQARRHGGFSGT
ncbi:hypothetical protein D910_10448, partial [Dendroctonus ponderosae]